MQIDKVVRCVIRRCARVLTRKQLRNPRIQARIKGIIERALLRRGAKLESFNFGLL